MSEFLKNILHGAGTIIDLNPSARPEPRLYDHTLSVEEALRRDWEKVGQDISKATEQYGKQAQG